MERIYAVPGNAGMKGIAECEKIEYENNFAPLARLISKEKIDFVVVGPEVPLVNGITDYLEKKKVAVFGPSKKAALLEGSKVFAKRFMKKYGIQSSIDSKRTIQKLRFLTYLMVLQPWNFDRNLKQEPSMMLAR